MKFSSVSDGHVCVTFHHCCPNTRVPPKCQLMVDASHGHVCVSFGSNNPHTRHKTQQAPMKLKLAAGAAGVRHKTTCSKKKSLHNVRRGRRCVVQRR